MERIGYRFGRSSSASVSVSLPLPAPLRPTSPHLASPRLASPHLTSPLTWRARTHSRTHTHTRLCTHTLTHSHTRALTHLTVADSAPLTAISRPHRLSVFLALAHLGRGGSHPCVKSGPDVLQQQTRVGISTDASSNGAVPGSRLPLLLSFCFYCSFFLLLSRSRARSLALSLFLCRSVRPSVRRSAGRSVGLSVCRSVGLSVCRSVCLSVCPSVCLSVSSHTCMPHARSQRVMCLPIHVQSLVYGVCNM